MDNSNLHTHRLRPRFGSYYDINAFIRALEMQGLV